jgi:hypothetical protein
MKWRYRTAEVVWLILGYSLALIPGHGLWPFVAWSLAFTVLGAMLEHWIVSANNDQQSRPKVKPLSSDDLRS